MRDSGLHFLAVDMPEANDLTPCTMALVAARAAISQPAGKHWPPQGTAASGQLADAFDLNVPLDLPAGLTQRFEMSEASRAESLNAALANAANALCDLSDLVAWPLHVGSTPKGCLVLQGATGNREETEILSGALAGLMGRASVESDLRHARKLQAIGELTGGIAHDFNNILAVVLGNAELVMDHVGRFGPTSEEVEMAGAILDAALRGAL